MSAAAAAPSVFLAAVLVGPTGEIVGVVSRGGSCSAHGNHVYTRVDAYSRLATAAFAAAERESKVAALPVTDHAVER